MTWRRYLTEIALAGGLAGGCVAQMMGGCTSSQGGDLTIPPCNANPDPCCACSEGSDGLGGYGGAACLGSSSDPSSCQSSLDCVTKPTLACCSQFYLSLEGDTPQFEACFKAGLGHCTEDSECAHGLVCNGCNSCAVSRSDSSCPAAGFGGAGGAGGASSNAGSGGASSSAGSGGAGGAGAGGASDGGA